jgi:type III pantothenate kinase
MLFVLDVGNTNTVLGVFARATDSAEAGESPRYDRLLANWRVATSRTSTVDEYGVLFRNLFSMAELEAKAIHGIVISSVVPPLDPVLRQVCERYFSLRPLFIEPGVRTGMPVQYENPAEVGADRIVNGVAAYDKYGGPCVIVDFGTATTFDCVSKKGEYLGGVICPGIGISADALFERTARLPRVEIRKPTRVIGTNTVGSLQSGLYYGYLGLVDGILELLLAELGPDTHVVATGGLGPMIGTGSKYIKHVDEFLTLEGLRIIWERNAHRESGTRPSEKAGGDLTHKKTEPGSSQRRRENGRNASSVPAPRSAR